MKTLAAALIIAASVLCASSGRAAEEEGSKLAALSSWFKNFKNGLADSAVRGKYQARRISTTAAVRGKEQGNVDPDRPEWKRSSRSENVQQRKERVALAAAIDLIVAGKFDDGQSALEAFEKDYPRSGLLPEAKEARENALLLAKLRGAAGPADPEASTTPAESAPAEKSEAPEKADGPKAGSEPVSAEPKAN